MVRPSRGTSHRRTIASGTCSHATTDVETFRGGAGTASARDDVERSFLYSMPPQSLHRDAWVA